MKIEISKNKISKVIELYLNNPFKDFTLENLRPIRQQTYLGYGDIKKIIIEYNTDTSAEHPTNEGEDIVRYSFEKRRMWDKEPTCNN